METTVITDLPVELLPCIFEYLPLSDLKNASQVCRSWEEAAFSRRFLNRIMLRVDLCARAPAPYQPYLFERTRAYKNVELYYRNEPLDLEMMLTALQKFGQSIVSLKICVNYFIQKNALRQIFLLVPNVEKLYISSRKCPKGGNQECFDTDSHKLDEINFRSMAPNITSLGMNCNSHLALSLYRQFSSQLRELVVLFKQDDFILPFDELSFPQVENLEFYCAYHKMATPKLVQAVCKFFRQIPNLKTAILRCKVNEDVFASIAENCPELTSFYLKGDCMRANVFRYLERLKKLKCLKIEACVQSITLQGCGPIPSLREMYVGLQYIDDKQHFFRLVKDIAPNLQTMETVDSAADDVFSRIFHASADDY